MIKYLETKDQLGNTVLIKLEAIRLVESRIDGCKVNESLALAIPYSELKKIVNEDERRVTYSEEMDFRLKYLIKENLWSIYKTFGNNRAVRYVEDICKCIDESQMYETTRKYINYDEGKCPNCGNGQFYNSWGAKGNSICTSCKALLDIRFEAGNMIITIA